MKSRYAIVSIGIVGTIVIAFSLAAFFLLDIERIAVNIWALIFLLLSEGILFGGLIALRFSSVQHSKAFLSAGVTTALLLYFAITLISVFWAGSLKERLNTFILIELAIVALFVIVVVSIMAFSRHTVQRNEEDIAKVGTTEPKRGGF